jgi:hypothetical protein
MRLYVLLPLAVTAACLAFVWFSNRRSVFHAALWPKGMRLAGPVESPDVEFDGELFLACAGRFGAIRCRTLRIGRGADVEAASVVADRVLVEGKLRGVASLAAEKMLVVRGELYADDVRAPRIKLCRSARAVVLTVPRVCRLERHPEAQVKGFFSDLDEAMAVDYVRRLESREAPTALPT